MHFLVNKSITNDTDIVHPISAIYYIHLIITRHSSVELAFLNSAQDEGVEEAVDDKDAADDRAEVDQELAHLPMLTRDYHLNRRIVKNNGNRSKARHVRRLLIVVQRVRVAVIDLLVDVVQELVGDDL